MTLLAERPPDEVDESELVVGRRIQEFSQLAGPIREPDPAEGAYRVAYRGVDAVHGRGRVARSLLVAGLNFAFEALFFLWLLHPSHRPPVFGSTFAIYANWIVIGSIGLMELLRLINVFSLSLASVIARDPVPVPPRPDQRVAFLTTIVPGKEPHRRRARHAAGGAAHPVRGILDVWLLDEGDDPDVKAMCRELGVHHFTRKGDREVQPAQGRVQGQDQARQLQRLARRARRRVRLLPLRRPRPRAAAQLRRADARLLPRPGRRLRRRPAVLRQLRDVRHARPPSRSSSCSTR